MLRVQNLKQRSSRRLSEAVLAKPVPCLQVHKHAAIVQQYKPFHGPGAGLHRVHLLMMACLGLRTEHNHTHKRISCQSRLSTFQTNRTNTRLFLTKLSAVKNACFSPGGFEGSCRLVSTCR